MAEDLKGCKVIMTGAAGAIGRVLLAQLLEAGAKVIGLDRELPEPVGRLMERYSSLKLIRGDLLETGFVTNAFNATSQDGGVSVVLHLAGQSDAPRCEANPVLAFQENTITTVNILEACVKNKISHFIFSSTGYVYGTQHEEKITEDFDVTPSGIYALTKLTCETIIRGYAHFAKFDYDILRISNIYGPGSKPNTVIGKLLSQYKKGDKIFLKDLTPVRDFIHVDDVVEAFLRLVLRGPSGSHVLNLSTGEGISIGELAALFCEIKGLPSQKFPGSPQPNEKVSRLILDNEALYRRLHWRPTICLRDGLKKLEL